MKGQWCLPIHVIYKYHGMFSSVHIFPVEESCDEGREVLDVKRLPSEFWLLVGVLSSTGLALTLKKRISIN